MLTLKYDKALIKRITINNKRKADYSLKRVTQSARDLCLQTQCTVDFLKYLFTFNIVTYVCVERSVT